MGSYGRGKEKGKSAYCELPPGLGCVSREHAERESVKQLGIISAPVMAGVADRTWALGMVTSCTSSGR